MGDMQLVGGPQETTEGEGMSVTIDKLPDGTFTVSANPGEPQPANSVEEALQAAKQLLTAGEAGQAKADIQAGYDKVTPPGGRPMMRM